MGENQERGIHEDQSADNSFWAALFQIEEINSNEVEESPPEILFSPQAEKALPPLHEISENTATAAPVTPSEAADPPDPWREAKACMDDDQVFHLRVIGHNKGGLLVAWNNLPGFVPASQLIDFPQFHIPRERLHSLSDWQNRELKLKIIEVDESQNRLIFSERATLVAAEQRETLLNNVIAGERREGIITNLTDFGAFVDLGGVEGLVHKSEISWSRVAHPSDMLQPGQSVQVLVLSVDQKAERIALSMKQLRPDPWLKAEERYKPGQQVRGIVGNIVAYGVFIILEEELEGLAHFSELAEGTFMHPRDVVKEGEEVVAKVLTVDSRRKRISLTLRNRQAATGSRP